MSGFSSFKSAVLSSIDPDDNMLITRGGKGHPELTAAGLGDSLLALFDKFFQKLDHKELRKHIRTILSEARAENDKDKIVNLFVMAFQVRWCRGGKV